MEPPLSDVPPEGATDCSACEFNFRPAEYVDESWFDLLGERAVLDRLSRSRRARPWLSRQLIRQFHLTDGILWSRGQDPLGLALLDPQALHAVVLRSGICLYASHLRSLVDGPSVRALVEGVGQDVYAFGLREGREILARLELPQAGSADATTLAREVPGLGVSILRAGCSDMADSIFHRLLIKLPLEWSHGLVFREPPMDAGTATRLLECVLNDGETDHDRYVGERNPAAHP